MKGGNEMSKTVKGTKTPKMTKDNELKKFAMLTSRELYTELRTSDHGLMKEDATERLEEFGMNIVSAQKPTPAWKLLLNAFKDPFVLVLFMLAVVSFITNDVEAAIVMIFMVLVSVSISFYQEYKSQKASNDLREMIENTAAVSRDGEVIETPMDEVVPGDIVSLHTGDMIPADAVLLESKDLFINQASLTGESLPVEKMPLKKVPDTIETMSAIDLPNLLFMGTDVLSGQGRVLIVKTGQKTFFGDIAKASTGQKGQTAFDIGLRKVSSLLLKMVAILFPVVFILNAITKHSVSDAFFFAIAVAVGLTPEMLPMIVNSNLAKGATTLAKHKVIVKKLSAIQNLGAMDILCTDKTGTITEDRVVLMKHVGPFGEDNDEVLNFAYMNSNYQTGWRNLMDTAVLEYFHRQEKTLPFKTISKVDEIPFDFSRRRLTVALNLDDTTTMITKGAVEEMESICSHVLKDGVEIPLTPELIAQMKEVNVKMNRDGMRVITVAIKTIPNITFSIEDESEMTIVGFVGFLDPAKASAITAISSLHDHGVTVKVLTGDNAIVAQKVCEDVGISADHYLLGSDIEKLSDAELTVQAEQLNLFAKLNPMQKSRVINVLKAAGHTVGFMGDGINDAPSLRAADVGISVDTAADITKDASTIILLEKSLQVLETGVIEGRRVFNNMMKYIKITLSSNFGNVFSILIASAFLPFLPMLSLQLLVQNLIYDVAQLAIPWDNVDEEEIRKPVSWEMKGLTKFTILIGPVSSIFDVVTFLTLWFGFHYSTLGQQGYFQTGWFAVGLLTQTFALHILRTKKVPFVKSNASLAVWSTTIGVMVVGVILMFTKAGNLFDLKFLPPTYYIALPIIVIGYLVVLQITKMIFQRSEK
jgi:Mg2+-importing ATPase